MARFAAIGLDHRHIYDLTLGLLAAGLSCAGYCPQTSDPRVLAGFRKRFPEIPAIARARLLDDPATDIALIAAIPAERASLAIEAMRRGKDVMVDKPGVTNLSELALIERTVAETGRIWSVALGRLLSPAIQEALRVARSGEIGRLVHITALAPHRLNRALRPAWFFDRPAYGGIINDLGSHAIDQFLAFSGAADAEIVMSTVGAFGTAPAGFEDFAELVLATQSVRGYVRLDWFTPDGLPTWGDGRLFVVGTEGSIELRKNLDIAGRPGTDHLFVANRAHTRYADCAGLAATYFRDFAADVANRTATTSPQRHIFTVCRLALEAQASAQRYAAAIAPG